MKTCFAYVRVSTAKQGEGASLDAQQDAITYFAERHDLKITEWFEEKETAAKSGRPVFTRMMRELTRGAAEGLVIHKIDRSARNFADWAKIGDLADAGIDVFFATESLDFNSRGGRLTADIQAVIAADYIRNLREEAKKGIYMRLKQGLYPFKAPAGYVDTGKGNPKTIDPVKGPLVRTMFELYATGNYSLWSLPPEMAARGLVNDRGRPYVKTGIEKILKNPFYTGIIRIKTTGQVYQGIHEPLIPVDLYEAVQDVRAGRENKKSTKHRHLYRGLFRCGDCQGAMIGELQRGKVYYRCHTRSCPTKTVQEAQLNAAAEAVLKTSILSDDDHARLLKAFSDEQDQIETDPMPERAPLELAKIEDRLDRLTDKLLDGVLDDDAFQAKKQKLLLDRRKWHDIAAKTGKSRSNIEKCAQFLERAKNAYFTYISSTRDRKREILKIATSNRIVQGKNITIEPDNWLLTLNSMLAVPCGAPSRPTSRTLCQDEDAEMKQPVVWKFTEALITHPGIPT